MTNICCNQERTHNFLNNAASAICSGSPTRIEHPTQSATAFPSCPGFARGVGPLDAGKDQEGTRGIHWPDGEAYSSIPRPTKHIR